MSGPKPKQQQCNLSTNGLNYSSVSDKKNLHKQTGRMERCLPFFSVSPQKCQVSNKDRGFDFRMFLFQTDALHGTIVQSVRRRGCGKACHLAVNSHALFFLSHTHEQQKCICVLMRVSMTCHTGHIPDQRAESFTIMYKDICLLGRAYVTEIQ